MATATLKVNADITELMAQLDNIKKQLGGLKEQNKDLNNTIDKGFKDNATATNQYTNNLKNAERELKSQKQIIAEMKASENQLKVARKQSNDPKEIARYDKELKRIAQDLATAKKEQVQLNSTYEKSKQKLKENTQALKEKNKEAKKSQKAFSKLGKILVAAFSVAAITSFVKKSLELYDIQARAEIKLLTALKGRKDIYNQLTRQATELQSKTRFGDEKIIDAQARLARILGTNSSALKQLTPLVLDFATAQGMDASSAADLLAKTLGSSTNSLARYGIKVTGAVGSVERLTSLTTALNKQVGGQAQAAANIGTASFTQLKNSWNDLLEGFGARVAKSTFGGAIIELKEIFEIRPSDVLKNEVAELMQLKSRINDVNISQEQRIKYIKELQQRYPQYLKDVNLETITNARLNGIISKINISLQNQIKIKTAQEAINIRSREAGKIEARAIDAQIVLEEKLEEALNEKTTADFRAMMQQYDHLSITDKAAKAEELYNKATGKSLGIYKEHTSAVLLSEASIQVYQKAVEGATKYLNKLKKQLDVNDEGLTESEQAMADAQAAIDALNASIINEDDSVKKLKGSYELLTEQISEAEKVFKNMLNSGKNTSTELEAQSLIVRNLKNELKLLDLQIEAYLKTYEKIKPISAVLKTDKKGFEPITEFYSNMSDAVTNAQNSLNAQIEKDLSINFVEKLFGDMLFTDEQKNAIKESFSIISSEINDFMDISVEKWSNILSSINTEISETEKKLKEEQQKQKEGLANTVKLEEQRLVVLAAKQKEAEAMQQEALNRQRTVDSITQSINMATAISGILKDLGATGVVGLALAPALIAGLLTLFKNSKQKAADAAKFEKGGYGVLGGKRHSEGGTYVPNIGEVEQGEFFGIINRKQTQKYQSGLAPLIDGINTNDSRKLIRGLNEIALRANLKSMQSGGGVNKVDINSKVSLNEISDIKKIRELIENGVSITYTDGFRIEKKGNITKRIKMN